MMVCTCPHHVHRTAFCKHMTAIENAADDTKPDNCACDGLGDFPYWPCVRTGRKELPN
ncbi:hypothetical protein [Haladaptatus sp. CMAA 1911]|uniref:hypothetical protein n=1 Tax=unclassified Haladaptatus TaxID=2622732 RepID=UPI0037549E07